MTNLSLKLKVSGLEPLKKLVGLLADNYPRLPGAVQEALAELYAEERLSWDLDYFHKIGVKPYSIKVIADGVWVHKVLAIYPEDCEMLIMGSGIRKFTKLEVVNAETGETICGV